MSCARCEALAEEVAYLKGELGLSQDPAEIESIKRALGLTRGQAAVLLALFRAAGKPRSRLQLIDAVPGHGGEDRDAHGVDVRIVGIRRVLGKAAVENLWGQGFRLSPEAVARVSEIVGGADA